MTKRDGRPKQDVEVKRPEDSDQASKAFGGWIDGGAGGQGHHSRGTLPDSTFENVSGILFEQAMAQTRMAICLSDPHADDQPIVFANRAFRELTGYDEDEIAGATAASCRVGTRTATRCESSARP